MITELEVKLRVLGEFVSSFTVLNYSVLVFYYVLDIQAGSVDCVMNDTAPALKKINQKFNEVPS